MTTTTPITPIGKQFACTMHTITPQTDLTSSLGNIDYEPYVNNVLSLLPQHIALLVSNSDVALKILDDSYLPFGMDMSYMQDVAEKVIAA